MAEEEWLPIPGAPDYEVSNLGRVKRMASLRPSGKGRIAKVREHIWRGYVDTQGYFSVNLGRARKVTVHRLVCEAFNGPPTQDRKQVAHYDGNKLNNRADNLRWANDKENRADSVRLGHTCSGERVWKARIGRDEVRSIRSEYESLGRATGIVSDIARRRGLSRGHVSAIVNRRIWATI